MIKITFEVPNLNEAEFVLRAVLSELEKFKQTMAPQPIPPTVEVEVQPTVQPQPQVVVPEAPKKAPGRPKKQPEPAAPVIEAPTQAPSSPWVHT